MGQVLYDITRDIDLVFYDLLGKGNIPTQQQFRDAMFNRIHGYRKKDLNKVSDYIYNKFFKL